MNFTIDNEYIQNSTILFQENLGQKDKDIKFMLCCKNFTLFFYKNKIKIDITTVEKSPEEFCEFNNKTEEFINSFKNKFTEVQDDIKSKIKIDSIEITFENYNEDVTIAGEDEQITKFNYYGFNLPKEGITNVSSFSKIKYNNIYSNIDLVFYSNESKLEFDFVVKPSGNPKNIKLIIDNDVTLDEDGNALISTKNSSLTLSKPVAYQIISDNNVNIESNFIKNDNSLCINIDDYNKSEELIIDPVLYYSTYYRYDKNDSTVANDITVNSQGEAYITGSTVSNSSLVPFVTKFNSQGVPLFHTSIQATGKTYSNSIALDSDNNIYITGYTNSLDFHFDSEPFYAPNGSTFGMFLTKLNSNGLVLKSIFILLSEFGDYAYSITLDKDENLYIAGYESVFSTTSKSIALYKFDKNLTVLLFITTGFGGNDVAYSIAVDDLYNIYFCGTTTSNLNYSANYIFGSNEYNPNNTSSFIYKLNISPDGHILNDIYLLYINGKNNDFAYSIAIDDNYNPYITGYTSSGNTYPIKPSDNIHGTSPNNNFAVFVTKFKSDGSDIIYSSYLHGNSADSSFKVALDSSNNAYITGTTTSTNFPTTNSFGASPDGRNALFVTKLNSSGDEILYSAYLHGKSASLPFDTGDIGISIAVDSKNNFYVTGSTNSIDFPPVNAYNSQLSGSIDSFVCKFVNDENLLEDIYKELTNQDYGLAEIKSEVKIIEDTVLSIEYGLPIINQNINNVENTLLNTQYGLPIIYNWIISINKNIYNLNKKINGISCALNCIDSKLNSIIYLLEIYMLNKYHC